MAIDTVPLPNLLFSRSSVVITALRSISGWALQNAGARRSAGCTRPYRLKIDKAGRSTDTFKAQERNQTKLLMVRLGAVLSSSQARAAKFEIFSKDKQ